MWLGKNRINKSLTVFLFAHVIIWTLVPSISNNNLPLDTIEALAWGSNLDWGFNKHPPLSAFVVKFFYQIFANQDWVYYLLSQLFVVLAFFVVFKFSKDFFKNPALSLISVLLLEGIYFYNFTTPEFNVNVCQIPFWALTVYYCWQGIKKNDNVSWLLFGFFGALGILSKYLFIYLLIGLDVFFIYLIVNKKIDLKCLVSLVSFFLVLTPHFFWLVENDYITITYALHRTGIDSSDLLNHLYYPSTFLLKQIGILLPFLIMLLFVISKFKKKLNFKDKKLLFLLIINITPIALIFLTSLIVGIKIRTMWMTPFYLFIGTLFIYIFENQINLKKLKFFSFIFIFLFILSPAIYLYVSVTEKDKRTDYPGKNIAQSVNYEWKKIKENNPKKIKSESINYIGWDEWYAGNLSYNIKGTKVLMVKFVDQLFETEDKNYILIQKNEKPKEVCELFKIKDNEFLSRYFFIDEHHVCFITNLKWMNK